MAQSVVKNVNDGMNRIDTRMSLIVGENASSTVQTFNTYDGRKFSDFRQLLFLLYVSKTEKSIIRQTAIIPEGAWVEGKTIFLIQNHGTSMQNVSGVAVAYQSDTSVSAYTLGAGGLVGFEIQGYIDL